MSESTHCRTCFVLIRKSWETTTKLSDKVANFHVTLGSMLTECTGLSLEDDTAPICPKCTQNLYSYYKFKQTVYETDQKFRELAVKIEEPAAFEFEIKLEQIKEEVEAWEPVYNFSYVNETPVDTKLQKKERRKIQQNRHLRPSREENYQRNAHELYECPKMNCNGLFKSILGLKKHLEEAHPENGQNSFPCEVCAEEFLTFILYKRHFMTFHLPRPFICDICGKNFPYLQYLRTHIRGHVKKRKELKSSCPICGKIFCNEKVRIRHQKNIHFSKGSVPKPFTCHVCGKNWSSKYALDSHMKRHGAAEFTCDICTKQFIEKSDIRVHMSAHLDEKRHSCDICGKMYKKRVSLRNHLASHKDERPFSCSLCPNTFKVKAMLRNHVINVHTVKDPVSCEVCGKLFKSKKNLREHMTLHNGKDIQCPYCEKSYKQKDRLKKHLKTIHIEIKDHQCTICFKNLGSRCKILRHIKKSHKDKLVATGKTAEEFIRI